MNFAAVAENWGKSKIVRVIDRALSSYFFPIVTSLVVFLCYYFGGEVVSVWYMCLSGAAIMLCCKDVTPIISLFLYTNTFVSVQHSPAYMGAASDYLFQTPQLVPLIIAAVIFIAALLARLIYCIVARKFKLTPIFWGLTAFSVSLILCGLNFTQYTPLNLAYGLGVSVILIGIFVLLCGNMQVSARTFKMIAYYFMIFFAMLFFMLVIAYATYEGLIVDGMVYRSKLDFGWGTYNAMGMLLTICIPVWFYMAGDGKWSWAYLFGGTLNLAACIISMSRQAILMSVLTCIACSIWLIIRSKGKLKIINSCIIVGVIVVTAIACGIAHKQLAVFFESLTTSLATGSGRVGIWDKGIKNFLDRPVFGVGFFDPRAVSGQPGYSGGNLTFCIPRMCHNTIIQMMSACGLVGIVAYLFHRAQTIISFINNPSADRLYLFFTGAAFLLVCLLDNHMFYFTPTLIYISLLALLALSEKGANAQGSDRVTEV